MSGAVNQTAEMAELGEQKRDPYADPGPSMIAVKEYKFTVFQKLVAVVIFLLSFTSFLLSIVALSQASNSDDTVSYNQLADQYDRTKDDNDAMEASLSQSIEDGDKVLQNQVNSLASSSGSTAAAIMLDVFLEAVEHGMPGNAFWDTVRLGFQDAAVDLGIMQEIRYPSYGSDPEDIPDMMLKAMEESAFRLRDGIALSLYDYTVLEQGVIDAKENGVPVVTLNSGLDDFQQLDIQVHVGQNETLAGFLAGEKFKSDFPSKTWNTVCVNHEPDNAGTTARCEGFAQSLGDSAVFRYRPTYNMYEEPDQYTDWLSNALDNDDYNGILTCGSGVAKLTYDTVATKGMSDDIEIATFDWDTDAIQAIKDQKLNFAIDQQEYLQGYIPYVLLTLKSLYDILPFPSGVFHTGPHMITLDDYEVYEQRDYSSGAGLKVRGAIKIAVVTHDHVANTFWDRVSNSVKKAGRDMGVIAEYRHPTEDGAEGSTTENDVEKMTNIIKEYTAGPDYPDGMVISIPMCPDSSSQRSLDFQSAVQTALGLFPVISINSGDSCYATLHEDGNAGTNIPPISAHVGQVESDGGTMVGQEIVSYYTDMGASSAKVLCVIIENNNDALQHRCDGIEAELNAASINFDFSTVLADKVDKTENGDIIADAISGFSDDDMIVTTGPSGAQSAMPILGVDGNPSCKLGTFDLDRGVLSSIANNDGIGLFCVDQQQYLQGYLPIVMHFLNAYWQNMPGAGQIIHTGPNIVKGQQSAELVLELVDAIIR